MSARAKEWAEKLIEKVCGGPLQTDARFRIDLLRGGLSGSRRVMSLLFGPVCAAIAVPWVPYRPILILWLVAVFLYPLAQEYWLRIRVFSVLAADTVDQAIEKTVISETIFHFLWLVYVPMCWKTGDAGNNAFLTIFMMGAVTSAVRRYGPCYHLAIAVIGAFLPFCAVYSLKTGTSMDFVIPIVQILYLGLLVLMTMQNYRAFRESDRRLRTIETLAANLSEARDEAENANRAKSAFLASMSHELRTPLNAIIGFSDMIHQSILGPVTPVKYREYAEDIMISGQHLLCLINDVLDLSKIEAGKRELHDRLIDVQEAAANASVFVRPQAEESNIEIRFDIKTNSKLLADERAIGQVLINILSNAIKFSPKGEFVTIFSRHTENGGLSLGVEDHGIGMDEEGIKKALEPYGQVSQTSQKVIGTGLGLPIAKALIEAHNAVFKITSIVGVGTTIQGDFPPERVISSSAY